MYELSEVQATPATGAIRNRSFAPSARLAPYVRAIEVVEASRASTRTLLPEPGLVLGLRYRGAATLLDEAGPQAVPDHAVTGMRATVRHMRTAAGGGIVLAKFTEVGAARLFDVPLHELFGRTVPLEAFFARSDLDRVASRLAGAADDRERVALLEHFLAGRWRDRPDDQAVTAAVAALRARRGRLRVGDLARALHLSQDALEKRFRRVVGTSPKQLASLLRLRHAVGAYRDGASLSWLALESGYYDQSHFIRDVRAATGQAPRAFLGRPDRC